MKKRIVFCVLLGWMVVPTRAQHTLIYTHPDAMFYEGKDLYMARNYAASYRCFEEFLKIITPCEAGQRQEAQFYMAANAFRMGMAAAGDMLDKYVNEHPYTPFFDRATFLRGMVAMEAKEYQKALNYFHDADVVGLEEYDQMEFKFNKGYAALKTGSCDLAAGLFGELKLTQSEYTLPASYYYAYVEYVAGRLDSALTGFLALENHPVYKERVQYYVVQIYYAQNNIAEVKARAGRILIQSPNHPDNAEIYRMLGEIAFQEKDYAAAIAHFIKYEGMSEKVIRTDVYLLGQAYYQTKDYRNAIKYLSKVTTEKDEMTENAYLHIGNAYVLLNDKVNARLAYEAALSTGFDPSVREEALFNYAMTTCETVSAFGESISAFERFLTEFPQSKHREEVYNYLVSVFMTSNNYREAYQALSKISHPNDKLLETKQYLLYKLGTEAFTQADYKKAIDHFTLSLQSSSTGKYSAEALFWRAESYSRVKQETEVIADLNVFFKNRYAAGSPNRAKAYYTLAYAYFNRQRYADALPHFLSFLKEEPNKQTVIYADAQNRIGDVYFSSHNLTEAATYYNRAAATAPDVADYAIFRSAYVMGLQKNYSGKIARLQELTSRYPQSEYADDALYEIGRSYLMLENDAQTIATYNKLLQMYPNSDLARKAALETGMVYFNRNELNKAVDAYKAVIAAYPGSEESYTALESLEAVYVEKDDVDTYLKYTQSLGSAVASKTVGREDSIAFVAAERQYMNATRREQAIASLNNYIARYCIAEGRYCATARFYLADSYYQAGRKEDALTAYKALLDMSTGGQYTEQAVIRAAEITYDQQQFSASLAYFEQLHKSAETTERKNTARLGILRCSNHLEDYDRIIAIVNEIMADAHATSDLKSEALYCRGKAWMAKTEPTKAIADFKEIVSETRTANGAEAKYLLAKLYFDTQRNDLAEKEIMDFAAKNTPHQYWLARSFILLSDIYMEKGDLFQAKQYLLSLQRNYTHKDDIESMIIERLKQISQQESQHLIN
jgi:tetratricopeptide (TPR) repeat protein